MFGCIEKFSGYDARQITDLESSNPQVSLWIVDLIEVDHVPFLVTLATYRKELVSFYRDFVFHYLLAL